MHPTESDDCWQKVASTAHSKSIPSTILLAQESFYFKWLLLDPGSIVLSLIWLGIMRQ